VNNILMTGMDLLVREEEKTSHSHHVIEVYRDFTGCVIRFHIFISERHQSFAHFDVLNNFSKWETIHPLLLPRGVEEALARLFVAAGGILNWPQGSKNSVSE